MKRISLLAVAAVAVALLGCPATPSQPTVRDHRQAPPDPDPAPPDSDPAPPDPDQPTGGEALADGEACTDSAQCASGVCEGPGCDQGTCASADRACTRDLRPYCGCDGQVFRASGTCPRRLFRNRGECTGAAAGGAKPVGAECLAAAECASGICEGEGCGNDQPGKCMDKNRVCTTDLRQYCGCDGQTFGGSGSCPGRRFAARGACK